MPSIITDSSHYDVGQVIQWIASGLTKGTPYLACITARGTPYAPYGHWNKFVAQSPTQSGTAVIATWVEADSFALLSGVQYWPSGEPNVVSGTVVASTPMSINVPAGTPTTAQTQALFQSLIALGNPSATTTVSGQTVQSVAPSVNTNLSTTSVSTSATSTNQGLTATSAGAGGGGYTPSATAPSATTTSASGLPIQTIVIALIIFGALLYFIVK